jgi:hypothetical protein
MQRRANELGGGSQDGGTLCRTEVGKIIRFVLCVVQGINNAEASQTKAV